MEETLNRVSSPATESPSIPVKEEEKESIVLTNEVNPNNLYKNYEIFLRKFHTDTPTSCKIAEHISKFDNPPTTSKKRFETWELYQIIKSLGGCAKVREYEKREKSRVKERGRERKNFFLEFPFFFSSNIYLIFILSSFYLIFISIF